MKDIKKINTNLNQKNISDLDQTFSSAILFSPNEAEKLIMSEEALSRLVQDEISQGLVIIDENGLTASMRTNLLNPARAFFAQWMREKSAFMTALSPYTAAINAVNDLGPTIEAIRKKGENDIFDLEERARQDKNYADAEQELEEAKRIYNDISLSEGNRIAKMSAYNPIYFLFLFLLGSVEFLINYQTFFEFYRTVFFSAGTAIVLGFALAFASHYHGTILRQWPHWFGPEKRKKDLLGPYRILVLANLAVTIVIVAAGGSRYVAAEKSFSALAKDNIIVPGIVIPVSNALRDVSLSLLSNIAVWIVGILIAYAVHDINPDFMDRTRQRDKANRKFINLQKPYVNEKQAIMAGVEKNIEVKTRAAEARVVESQDKNEKYLKIKSHDQSITRHICGVIQNNIELYHRILCQEINKNLNKIQIYKDNGASLSPAQLNAIKIKIDVHHLQA